MVVEFRKIMLVNFTENVRFTTPGTCVASKFPYTKNMTDPSKKKYNNMHLEVKKKKTKKKFEEAATSCISLTTILLYFSLELFELFLQCCHQGRFKRLNGFVTV